MALDIKSAVKSSAGKWRLAATPSGPANFGSSFLTITKNAADPQKAFDVIKYMLSPDNEAKAFADGYDYRPDDQYELGLTAMLDGFAARRSVTG